MADWLDGPFLSPPRPAPARPCPALDARARAAAHAVDRPRRGRLPDGAADAPVGGGRGAAWGCSSRPTRANLRPPSDFDGVAVTYARVAQSGARWAQAVLAGDARHRRRGAPPRRRARLGQGFDARVRRAPRAGCCCRARRFAPTPRRSRACATTATASRVPDVAYSYADAVRDGVCRPVTFVPYDGVLQWQSRRGDDRGVVRRRAHRREAARRYRTAISVELADGLPRILARGAREAARRSARAATATPAASSSPPTASTPARSRRCCARSRARRRPSSCTPRRARPRSSRRSARRREPLDRRGEHGLRGRRHPAPARRRLRDGGQDAADLPPDRRALRAHDPGPRRLDMSWLYLPGRPGPARARRRRRERAAPVLRRRPTVDDGLLDEIPRAARDRAVRGAGVRPASPPTSLPADGAVRRRPAAPPAPARRASPGGRGPADDPALPAFERRALLRDKRHRLVSDLRRSDGRTPRRDQRLAQPRDRHPPRRGRDDRPARALDRAAARRAQPRALRPTLSAPRPRGVTVSTAGFQPVSAGSTPAGGILARQEKIRGPSNSSLAASSTSSDYAIFMLDPDGTSRPGTRAPSASRATAPTRSSAGTSRSSTREDARRDQPELELEIADREGRFEDEGWRVRKDGSRFWANVVITALPTTRRATSASRRSRATSPSAARCSRTCCARMRTCGSSPAWRRTTWPSRCARWAASPTCSQRRYGDADAAPRPFRSSSRSSAASAAWIPSIESLLRLCPCRRAATGRPVGGSWSRWCGRGARRSPRRRSSAARASDHDRRFPPIAEVRGRRVRGRARAAEPDLQRAEVQRRRRAPRIAVTRTRARRSGGSAYATRAPASHQSTSRRSSSPSAAASGPDAPGSGLGPHDLPADRRAPRRHDRRRLAARPGQRVLVHAAGCISSRGCADSSPAPLSRLPACGPPAGAITYGSQTATAIPRLARCSRRRPTRTAPGPTARGR